MGGKCGWMAAGWLWEDCGAWASMVCCPSRSTPPHDLLHACGGAEWARPHLTLGLGLTLHSPPPPAPPCPMVAWSGRGLTLPCAIALQVSLEPPLPVPPCPASSLGSTPSLPALLHHSALPCPSLPCFITRLSPVSLPALLHHLALPCPSLPWFITRLSPVPPCPASSLGSPPSLPVLQPQCPPIY